MIVSIKKSCIKGEVTAIPSKSYIHRIEIANFLAKGQPIKVADEYLSDDIKATKNCVEKIKLKRKILDCGESGTTLRFMLPLCAALGGEYEFIGHGQLMHRPNEELIKVLNKHWIKVTSGDTIKIKGTLSCGDFYIPGNVSSQYISGLLMALPILNGNSNIILTEKLLSKPYVDITLEVLRKYGIKITEMEYGFHIPGSQKYVMPDDYKPEGDWSNMGDFIALGILGGEVKVNGLNEKSFQGDRALYDILKDMGADISASNGSIIAKKSVVKPFTYDAKDTPDLVPVLAVLGACADGDTTIKNVERLRLKESDRIESIINMLSSFNIKAECKDNDLIIHGGTVKGNKVNTYNDHRIVMAAAVLGLVADGETSVLGAQAVNKSYPTFFDDLKKTGGILYEY